MFYYQKILIIVYQRLHLSKQTSEKHAFNLIIIFYNTIHMIQTSQPLTLPLQPLSNSYSSTTSISKHFSLISLSPNPLFLGDLDSALDIPTLSSLSIFTILTAIKNIPLSYSPPSSLNPIQRHKILPILDEPDFNISKYFNESYNIIEKGLEIGGVLVHCAAGVSRVFLILMQSATLVIAYLMRKNRWRLAKAYKYVKEKRGMIKPNKGFEIQLMKYEHYLNGLATQKIQKDKEERRSMMLVRNMNKEKERDKEEKERSSRKSLNQSRLKNNLSLASSKFRISKPKPLKL